MQNKPKNALQTFVGATAMSKPSAVTKQTANGVRVKNREIVSSVQNNGGVQQFARFIALNPTGPEFSWLRGVARNYSKYRVHSFRLSFVSSVPSSQPGTVVMGIFYDYVDAYNWYFAYDNETPIEPNAYGLASTDRAVIGPVYGQTMSNNGGTFTMAADTTKVHASKPWFISQDGPPNVDVDKASLENQIAFGFLCFTVIGQGTTSLNFSMGYLVADYDIEFINPVVYSPNTEPFLLKRPVPDCPPPPGWQGSVESWHNFVRYNRKGICPVQEPAPSA